MQPSTTLNQMMAGNKIIVPAYQRAYTWETPLENQQEKGTTQTDVFVADLEEHIRSFPEVPYPFGHFLFEQKPDGQLAVIDGQQRLTTVVIFLSALFFKLKTLRERTEEEEALYENMIKWRSSYRFSTLSFDDPLLKDYVINRVRTDKLRLETPSGRRIVQAYDYFTQHFEKKEESYLVKMLQTVSRATCTTYVVKSLPEALQLFIFKNDRGRKPSNVEILKARFMYNVLVYGDDDKDEILDEMKRAL